jgi:nucleotide-binding universal stress UspA family protein
MIVLKNILVATDFGEASESALTYGRHLARTFCARLHVLHVADNIAVRLSGDATMAFLPDLQTEVERQAAQRLAAVVSEDDKATLNANAVLLTSARPGDAIVQYARDAAIDLIVMGTHGRRALAHVLMGSVAEGVVRTAPCPVLTVRHPEREFIAPDALVAVAKA